MSELIAWLVPLGIPILLFLSWHSNHPIRRIDNGGQSKAEGKKEGSASSAKTEATTAKDDMQST